MQHQELKAPDIGIWLLLVTWVAGIIGNLSTGAVQIGAGIVMIWAAGYAAWAAARWLWSRYGTHLGGNGAR